MPDATVRFNAAGIGSALQRLATAERFARAPMTLLGKDFLAITREQIGKEFGGGFFFNRSGGRTPWPRTKPFGTRPAPSATLGGSGSRYNRAWQGGPGGSSRITSRRIELSVNLPGAAMHRGGTGARPKVRGVTRVRAIRTSANGRDSAMRIFLGMEYGAWISDDTLRGQGLAVPARPHAARHPEGVRRMLDLVEQRLEAR